MDVPIREAGMYCLAFASARADRAELMNLLYSRKPWPMRFYRSSDTDTQSQNSRPQPKKTKRLLDALADVLENGSKKNGDATVKYSVSVPFTWGRPS